MADQDLGLVRQWMGGTSESKIHQQNYLAVISLLILFPYLLNLKGFIIGIINRVHNVLVATCTVANC